MNAWRFGAAGYSSVHRWAFVCRSLLNGQGVTMKSTLLWAGAALLAVMVGVMAALLLPTCGLRLPFGLGQVAVCPSEVVSGADEGMLRAALRSEIAALERGIAGVQCVPAPEPQTLPEPEAVEMPPLPELNEDLFDGADLSDLQGCWQLDSPYAAQNVVTGEVIAFSEWTVCFNNDGTGVETMRGSDGSTCEGPITGHFIPGQALIIEEEANLPCSNNFEIFRRTVTCRLDEQERALCNSYQAEGGGSAEVIMRRLQEVP